MSDPEKNATCEGATVHISRQPLGVVGSAERVVVEEALISRDVQAVEISNCHLRRGLR